MIEAGMLRGPWVMGEAYSICDPYLFTVTRWLGNHELDVARWPKVAYHHRRMMEIPAVGRVLKAEGVA
jgi:glutathione S-transferase